MHRPAQLDRLAQHETKAVYEWYQRQSTKAAVRFAVEFSRAVRAIEDDADRFPAYLKGTRRCLLKKFPYLIVFKEYPDHVFIVAVAHSKRRPGYWSRRLK